MSIWVRLSDFLSGPAATALNGVVEAVRTALEGDPETRRKVSFSVAMIALSAKMAKADGVVTSDEVDAFTDIFEVPEAEANRVSRLYNLAKQDTAGFEAYAQQIAQLCGSGQTDCPMLVDILDGLFHIAKADGIVHDKEIAFLRDVSSIFGISELEFERILARHVKGGDGDPYLILGIERDTPFAEARARYLALVRDNHPDNLSARGIPEEFSRIANERLAEINHAWDQVEKSLRH